MLQRALSGSDGGGGGINTIYFTQYCSPFQIVKNTEVVAMQSGTAYASALSYSDENIEFTKNASTYDFAVKYLKDCEVLRVNSSTQATTTTSKTAGTTETFNINSAVPVVIFN